MSQQHAQIFINLPCKRLPASKAFFESLGYQFNPQMTNEAGPAWSWAPTCSECC